MALLYTDMATQSADAAWIGRVKASLVTAAIAIAEDAPNSVLNTRRDTLARAILRNPDQWALTFSLGVATGMAGETSLATATDAEIDSRISAIFNDYL